MEKHINKKGISSIYWFRKCLRLHDNPALIYSLEQSRNVYPVFILDPWFVKNGKVGSNRWRFLLQSLEDLNKKLIEKNSRLILLQGRPSELLKEKMIEWKIDLLCFEVDTEPYAKQRDDQIRKLAEELNVNVVTKWSHTLYNLEMLFEKNKNKTSATYVSFLNLIKSIGKPEAPLKEPDSFPKVLLNKELYTIPDLNNLGIDESKLEPCKFHGGETEALKRMDEKFKNESWIALFEKPNTSPNSLEPSTTVLSPYLKFGCLSVRLFYSKIMEVYSKQKNRSEPPTSLEGQLLFREYFYFVGAFTNNFDKIEGNEICRKINWDTNDEFFQAWKNARTGYPFIDAIMTQLRKEGWIHHLGRHAVACFLTRGDLYLSWVKGQEVFEEWLLDADWSLNAANWMWLSASAFFNQYWRVYSPIGFGQKTDKNGEFIRKYLPILKDFPEKYIYEPWNAPLSLQKTAKCIIGKDYPQPIVDHKIISKKNMERMKIAFQSPNSDDLKKSFQNNKSPNKKKEKK